MLVGNGITNGLTGHRSGLSAEVFEGPFPLPTVFVAGADANAITEIT